jgi:hypothetical protein
MGNLLKFTFPVFLLVCTMSITARSEVAGFDPFATTISAQPSPKGPTVQIEAQTPTGGANEFVTAQDYQQCTSNPSASMDCLQKAEVSTEEQALNKAFGSDSKYEQIKPMIIACGKQYDSCQQLALSQRTNLQPCVDQQNTCLQALGAETPTP